jgi:hypothetical protein
MAESASRTAPGEAAQLKRLLYIRAGVLRQLSLGLCRRLEIGHREGKLIMRTPLILAAAVIGLSMSAGRRQEHWIKVKNRQHPVMEREL